MTYKNKQYYIECYEKEFKEKLKQSGKSIEEFELTEINSVDVAVGFCLYYSTNPVEYWKEHKDYARLNESDMKKVYNILCNF